MQDTFTGTGVSGSSKRIKIAGVRTLAGETATLLFAIADNVATAGVIQMRQFFGTGGSPSATVQSNAAIAISSGLTLNKATFAIPSIDGKTLGTNGDDYLEFIFIPTVANGHVLSLGNVCLFKGDVPITTPFPYRSEEEELALCLPYYEAIEIGATGLAAVAQAYNTSTCLWDLVYTPKRIDPTITVPTTLVPFSAAGAALATTSHTISTAKKTRARVTTIATTTGLAAGNAVAIYSAAGSTIAVSAEY